MTVDYCAGCTTKLTIQFHRKIRASVKSLNFASDNNLTAEKGVNIKTGGVGKGD